MYIPKSFSQTDLNILHTFMQEHSFATLVSQTDEGLVATHLPLLVDKSRGEYGTLLGHMAKANQQWKGITERESLVIFQGPHSYISPNWYETHPSVPTWNYTTVHAYGTPRLVDDPEIIKGTLATLVDYHESGFLPAWEMNLPEDYMHKMMQSIVAIEIPITRLEGKFKLSQNRSEEDQARVTETLVKGAYPAGREVGALMQKISEGSR
jgi:transcriptional regulator